MSSCQHGFYEPDSCLVCLRSELDRKEKALIGLRRDYELNNNRANQAEAKLAAVMPVVEAAKYVERQRPAKQPLVKHFGTDESAKAHRQLYEAVEALKGGSDE